MTGMLLVKGRLGGWRYEIYERFIAVEGAGKWEKIAFGLTRAEAMKLMDWKHG